VSALSYDPEIAEIRFGCGLSPSVAPPAGRQAMLDGLTGPDEMAAAFPIETFPEFRARMVEASENFREIRKRRGTPEVQPFRKRRNLINKAAREAMVGWQAQTFLRWTRTAQPMHERLAFFWADHFTAVGKNGVLRRGTSPYVEAAIRPNMTGSFADLLIAATISPLMLHYLDQGISIGPESPRARKGGRRGLNENLAREVLELHTLGVDGPYGQEDVRQLAELFTGLTYNPRNGFTFRKDFAEPGPETVLGVTYGGDPARLEPVLEALRALALHPATARHIAAKLAVHFVADAPDPALVDHLAGRFADTGGQLMAVYEALLEHPAAWAEPLGNAKPPADFIASACRALDVPPDTLQSLEERAARRMFFWPLGQMGQPWQSPSGPDGWPEEDADWITPQGVAARMRWAMQMPQRLCAPRGLPHPESFVQAALGSRAPGPVRFAASAAESRSEAIGLVLASPAFQRR